MWHDPTFWVAIAFVVFVIAVFKPAKAAICGGLDARADRIRAELEEAARLREEAQKMLADYKRKQSEAAKEAEAMLAHAKEEAETLRQQAAADLAATLKRREAAAVEKIAQAEAQALQEVRHKAVDIAVAATASLLKESIDETKASALVDQSIQDLQGKLH